MAKYTKNGDKIWSNLIGGSKNDTAQAIIIDNEENIIITGTTLNDLEGNKNSGGSTF